MYQNNVDGFGNLVRLINEAKGWKVPVDQQWKMQIDKSKPQDEGKVRPLIWEDADVKQTKKEKFVYHRRWELRPLT